MRLRILGLLRGEGPLTATGLATKLGVNSGATSYHLRQLAHYGLIVDDTERGTGRERWWRAAHRSSRLDLATVANEDMDAGVAYLQALALLYADTTQRAIEERPNQPRTWQEAGTLSDYAFRLTADEAKSLVGELREILSRYRADQGEEGTPAPPGTEPFHVQLHAFIRPGHDISERSGSAGDEEPLSR